MIKRAVFLGIAFLFVFLYSAAAYMEDDMTNGNGRSSVGVKAEPPNFSHSGGWYR